MKKYPVYSLQNFSCNDIQRDFYINTFKEHLKNHRFVEEPHRHDSYVMVFFTDGSGIHEIDFDKFEIKQGSLFVLQPGQIHHWSLSEDIEGFVIIFSQELYNLYFGQKKINDYNFYHSVHNRPEIVFKKNEIPKILPYFDLLIQENLQNNKLQVDMMLNLLDCINIEISRKYSETYSHQVHSYNIKINMFELLLEQYFTIEKLPSFYAEKLNITLKHLNRICNEILQKTATEVIVDRVILEIKRMLIDKELAVNEVAFKVGYEDYSYFSRFFKKQTGMSPTEFRNTPR
ncbi:helix-turn-helix domain-containing protein [Flavobacterium sp. Fl-77]|uniref:Helix-turn-helix domain-containing protein n=1 Tax=Flavobacterium flavipigmentatum TaxID=2893884 RepID=A0AAJ2VZB0_9FLAO|nr:MULTISPECIES: helix-turn-helix domain-containing protein [unclassified Flavobacterium]MDX6183875.1 helix-turn-helix domain-containing protein [Flavobacterium sp. Fl-33]MDX6187380.1 helix-turn-helix domain-containing protein [Flavobacterium sp. Fl-77]UFH40284.1 AraC family transcriptional regulator [Flavobacterium sp. F-70]